MLPSQRDIEEELKQLKTNLMPSEKSVQVSNLTGGHVQCEGSYRPNLDDNRHTSHNAVSHALVGNKSFHNEGKCSYSTLTRMFSLRVRSRTISFCFAEVLRQCKRLLKGLVVPGWSLSHRADGALLATRFFRYDREALGLYDVHLSLNTKGVNVICYLRFLDCCAPSDVLIS